MIFGPAGHSPAARRKDVRSANGSCTVQCDSGEAWSSCSGTGRRYGRGSLPKTWSLPYVWPFEVEKYTLSAGRSPYMSTWPAVRCTAAYHRCVVFSRGTGMPPYTWHEVVAQIGFASVPPAGPCHPVSARA